MQSGHIMQSVQPAEGYQHGEIQRVGLNCNHAATCANRPRKCQSVLTATRADVDDDVSFPWAVVLEPIVIRSGTVSWDYVSPNAEVFVFVVEFRTVGNEIRSYPASPETM